MHGNSNTKKTDINKPAFHVLHVTTVVPPSHSSDSNYALPKKTLPHQVAVVVCKVTQVRQD